MGDLCLLWNFCSSTGCFAIRHEGCWLRSWVGGQVCADTGGTGRGVLAERVWGRARPCGAAGCVRGDAWGAGAGPDPQGAGAAVPS